MGIGCVPRLHGHACHAATRGLPCTYPDATAPPYQHAWARFIRFGIFLSRLHLSLAGSTCVRCIQPNTLPFAGAPLASFLLPLLPLLVLPPLPRLPPAIYVPPNSPILFHQDRLLRPLFSPLQTPVLRVGYSRPWPPVRSRCTVENRIYRPISGPIYTPAAFTSPANVARTRRSLP